MCNKAQISVIIPIYNVREYVRETVDSIISQKEFLHEIILVDDGSTDGTGELLEQLYGNLDYVKIVHKENGGQGLARNYGTDISTGNFIYYFDSDDLVTQGLFEKFCQLIFHYPELEIFCFSGESFLDGNYVFEDVLDKNIFNEKALKRKIEVFCNSGEEALTLLENSDSFFVYPFLYIFKKTIITKNDIRFKAIKNEDGEFIYQLFLHAGQALISNDVFVKYRIRQGSTAQVNQNFKDILGRIKTIETLERLIKLDHLKNETKEILKKKIISAIRSIIYIKVRGNMKLSKEEKNIYKNSLRPFILSNINLLFMYYTYSLEYKLRMIKKRWFN